MSFTTHEVLFLQRLANDRPAQRQANALARHLCEHYSLGVVVGSQVVYGPQHHQQAAALLDAHDLPRASAQGASRAEIAQFGGLSEKTFSTAPHTDSVAVRCVGNCTLDGMPLVTPAGSYLVVTADVAERIACDRILLVENLEPFRQLERYRWIDFDSHRVLVVYRGDSSLSLRTAAKVLRRRRETLWAFVDFDPAGLLIANGLDASRLEAIILPELEWIRRAADNARGRELFETQLQHAARALESSPSEVVRQSWSALKATRSALTQERMAMTKPTH